MWTNVMPLFRSVTPMPLVRIPMGLIAVPANLDLLEMAKTAVVRLRVNLAL